MKRRIAEINLLNIEPLIFESMPQPFGFSSLERSMNFLIDMKSKTSCGTSETMRKPCYALNAYKWSYFSG